MGWSPSVLCPNITLYLGNSHPSLDPLLAILVSPFLQEGYLKTLHLNPSPQGSQRFRTVTLLAFRKIDGTTNNLAVSLVTTLTASTKRGRACYYPPVEYPTEISGFPSSLTFFCYVDLTCVFTYWHVYSEAIICYFSLIIFSLDVISSDSYLLEVSVARFHSPLECGVSNRHNTQVFFHM